MKKLLEVGGLIAAVVLVAFGIGAIVIGADGRSTVKDSLIQESIVGTPDMSPDGIKPSIEEAGLTGVEVPDCDVADQEIDNGDRARCFAEYLRIHALESTDGLVYAQMGQFEAKADAPESELTEDGATNNPEYAVVDTETGGPKANGPRNTWVTATALSTALNSSYMADQMGLFGIVVGIALLLTGLGFAVLVLTGAVRDPETALRFMQPRGRSETTS